MSEKDREFPVKVGSEIYGPIPLQRIIDDVKNGELTNDALFWDGEDWIPVTLLQNKEIPVQIWNEDNWIDKPDKSLPADGPPLPASSAWEDVSRKGRWMMIYGDHLVVEGGGLSIQDIGPIIEGEPRNGGIPMKKLLNVTFKDNDRGVDVIASSFHKMYEVYSLKCCLSKGDSNKLMKELQDAGVRIIS